MQYGTIMTNNLYNADQFVMICRTPIFFTILLSIAVNLKQYEANFASQYNSVLYILNYIVHICQYY